MESKTATIVREIQGSDRMADRLVAALSQFDHAALDQIADARKLMRATLGKKKSSPFLWAVGSKRCGQQFTDAIQVLHRRFWGANISSNSDRGIEAWSTDGPTIELACIALCSYGFPIEWRIEKPRTGESQPKDFELVAKPLESQLRFVEMPLWNLVVSEHGAEPVSLLVHRFELLVKECLDGDGWPEARIVSDAGMLAASWCRCFELLKHQGRQIDPDVYFMLSGLNQQLRRLSRRDGSLLLGESGGGINCNSFKKCLQRNFSDSFWDKLTPGSKKLPASRQPAASSVSEWGQVCVLQKSWKRGCRKVAVAFGDRGISMDISQGRSIVASECTPQLLIDGKPREMISEIGVSGFLRFDRGDYLELELEFDGANVQRQILFLSADDLLLVNDVVKTEEQAEIEYSSGFRLGDEIELMRESENNEFYLKHGGDYSLVIPLALPEWKTERCDAQVRYHDDQFQTCHRVNGKGLAFPLVFDLNSKRSQQPRTWRRLTVAESMQIVGEDLAVAYRVQLAREQWLIYRAVSAIGNRTFLGQNYADEFYFGKIDREGKVTSLLEIE